MDKSPQLKLKPSRHRAIFLLVLSLVLVALSTSIFASGNVVLGWLCTGFFALGVLTASVSLMPGSGYLLLTPDGFEVRVLYRKTFIRWVDVRQFIPLVIHKRPMAAWDYVTGYEQRPILRSLSTRLGGAEAALPDTYGMSAEALSSLLNQWRVRYGVAP